MIAQWVTMGVVTLAIRVMVDMRLGPTDEDFSAMRDPRMDPEEIPMLWVSLLMCVLGWPYVLVQTAIKLARHRP